MPLCSSHLLVRQYSKSFKLIFNSTWTENFQIYNLVWGTRDKIANIHWIIEKARESQKNISICFTDYAKAFHCVDHNKLWKILKEIGVPYHLTCLLTSLYVGQNGQSMWTKLSFLGQTFRSLWPFHNSLGIRSTKLICRFIDFQGTCDCTVTVT